MLIIGIIDDNHKFQTKDLLIRIYQKRGLSVFAGETWENSFSIDEFLKHAAEKNAEIIILSIHSGAIEAGLMKGISFHILIYMDGGSRVGAAKQAVPVLSEGKNILIINSDCKNMFPFSIGTKTTLITCGLNGRASVTASSVNWDDGLDSVQCCIQRAISTIGGERLEPQEFAVSVPKSKHDVTGVLAAVSAAIADDVEISELNLLL